MLPSALTGEQVQHLAEIFGLSFENVLQLGVDLVWALHAENGPRSVTDTAEQKGTLAFKAAMNDISKGTALLASARKQLRQLKNSIQLAEDRYTSSEQDLFAMLIEAEVKANLAAELFQEREASGMTTKLRGTGDKRRDIRVRRGMVCTCIMIFWQSLDPTVSYTSEHDTSHRSGQLIAFINAVTACITDPSTSLNGATRHRRLMRSISTKNRHPSGSLRIAAAGHRRALSPWSQDRKRQSPSEDPFEKNRWPLPGYRLRAPPRPIQSAPP